MLRKLGKSSEDLTKTDMMLKDFEGVVSPAVGALCVDLTIGSKTLPTTFFVINGKGSYSLLLGRDWIHANCCIPSTMCNSRFIKGHKPSNHIRARIKSHVYTTE